MRTVLLDSITHLQGSAHDAVVMAASHGGRFSAEYARRAGVRGLILHDAGIGMDRAGIEGLELLDQHGVPAAAISHRSARIGDGDDCWRRGRITSVNHAAKRRSVSAGMRASVALEVLASQPGPNSPLQPSAMRHQGAVRKIKIAGQRREVWLADSASLVTSIQAEAVVVTGSHGGLLGRRPDSAIKTQVYAALYNDAGMGRDSAGISRLPALAQRGIVAATVDAHTARIGDANSSYRDGIISAVNEPARASGIELGMSARDFVSTIAKQTAPANAVLSEDTTTPDAETDYSSPDPGGQLDDLPTRSGTSRNGE